MEVVAGKVADYLFGVARREISYTCNVTLHIEILKQETQNMVYMKEKVEQHIYLATSKGEPILEEVKEWMEKTGYYLSDATEFVSEAQANKTCFNVRLCVNLGTLRRYSKTAAKKTSILRQHQQDGMAFETCVSLPAPTPGFTDLYQGKNLENIDTQKLALKEIIEAIEDENIQIVGINGLGGVGKTTLACEVAKEMKNKFADIVFVTVSQTVDAKLIQEKVQVAARKVINGDKVLIILDDVWEELKLEDFGIPCGSEYMNCKILLTSRIRDVCEAMNAQKNISVNPLRDEEAWTLFERMVGKSEWDDTLKEVALQIVKECSGLPLFIQTIGKALKYKDIRIWEATLRRLQDRTDEDAPFKRIGLHQLKLSYDYLEDEVAKSCFLLCSMFPEDEVISLKTLTLYGLALGIFNNSDSNINDAKDRVQCAVDSLKSTFLLLPKEVEEEEEDDDDELLKMHDLVRDMALFITSKGDDKFFVKSGEGLREWQPRIDVIKSYKKISLMENKICKLPDYELDLPHLDTFLIQNNELSIVPDEFFRGMKKLKVLDISGNDISSLPQSLKQLTILHLLDLSGNRSLCEISILGELVYLEILKLRNTSITNIPREIERLINLRLLDVYSCEDLSYVTPGVISKLTKLEELYVQFKKGNCNFLEELSKLKSLKILHLLVCELPTNETSIEFDLGKYLLTETSNPYKCRLHVSESSFPFNMPVMKLIQVSEMLKLWYVNDLDNILPKLYQEGFDKLKYIELVGCANVKSLVKTCDMDAMQTFDTSKGKFFSQVKEINLEFLDELELLWDRPHQSISFCNLGKIKIEYCHSLFKLFPLSVARSLNNLKSLEIVNCKSLEVVISAGDEQTPDTDIVFPLTDIYLYDLPILESFYSGRSIIKYRYLTSMVVGDCPIMKKWSHGDSILPHMNFYQEGMKCSINDYIKTQHEMNGNWRIWKKRSHLDDSKDENY